MRAEQNGKDEWKMKARKEKNSGKKGTLPKMLFMISSFALAIALFISSVPLGSAVSLYMNQDKLVVSPTTGNVGIGTANPVTKLDIYGGHTTTKFMMNSTGDGATNDAYLSMWASEPGVTYTGAGIGNNINGHPYYGRIRTTRGGSYIRLLDNAIALNTINSAGTDTNAIYISGGNVGIGTTAPTQKLDVQGNIKTTGSIYAPAICLAGDCRTSWPAATGTVDWSGITNKPAFAANAVGGRVRAYEIGCGSGWASSCDSNTNGYTDIADNGIPSGMIAMFDSACPSGWTRVSALDNRFPMGATTYGTTGGAATHSHTVNPAATSTTTNGDHYHLQTGGSLLSGPGPHYPAEQGFRTSTEGAHAHTVDIASTTSSSDSNLPPYVTVIFCRKN